MKFAYLNPTIVAMEDVPSEAFVKLHSIVEFAHTHAELNDEGNAAISIRGGQQIQLYPNVFNLDISFLKRYVEEAAQEYMDNIQLQNPTLDLSAVRPEMVSAWTIRQTQGDYQTLHTHEANISGNIYIDVPAFAEDSKAYDGNIEFRFPVMRNPAHFVFQDNWRVAPEQSKMIVFPGNIPHTVYPWRGEGTRTVLAWDVKLIDRNA
jgi:hypothetical protein